MLVLILLLSLLLHSHLCLAEKPLIDELNINSQEDIWELFVKHEITYEEYENLTYLYQHPLDINKARLDELTQLPDIDLNLARKLQAHRPFKQLEEISQIVGQETIERIKPFIKTKRVRQGELELRLTETVDDGKMASSFIRGQVHTVDGIQSGVILKQQDNDHLKKGYIGYQSSKSQVVLGNYRAKFGQGIVFNTAHRSEVGILADDTIRISDLNQGIAVGFFSRLLSSSIFYSCVDLQELKNPTLTEFDDQEGLYGANIALDLAKKGHWECTGYQSEFRDKQGKLKRVSVWGIGGSSSGRANTRHHEANRWEKSLALELACSSEGGKAGIINGLADRGKLSLEAVLYRYDQNFLSPHGVGFSVFRRVVGPTDTVGSSFKISYKPNTSLRLEIRYGQEKQPSNLIVDEEFWGLVRCRLTKKAVLLYQFKLRNKGLQQAVDPKKNSMVKLILKPLAKAEITSDWTRIDHSGDKDDYFYLKSTYLILPQLRLSSRIKYAHKVNSSYKQGYLEIAWKGKRAELTGKYSLTKEEDEQEPIYNLYLRMRVFK